MSTNMSFKHQMGTNMVFQPKAWKTELDEGLEGPTYMDQGLGLEPPTSLEPPAETELDACFLDTLEAKLFKVI